MSLLCCRQRGETVIRVEEYFLSEKSLEIGEPRVYVPYWVGKAEIYAVQKMLPIEVPVRPLRDREALGGKTVDPADVPILLYDLSATQSYAYSEPLSARSIATPRTRPIPHREFPPPPDVDDEPEREAFGFPHKGKDEF